MRTENYPNDGFEEVVAAYALPLVPFDPYNVLIGGVYPNGSTLTFNVISEDIELGWAYARESIRRKRWRLWNAWSSGKKEMREVHWEGSAKRVPQWFIDEYKSRF